MVTARKIEVPSTHPCLHPCYTTPIMRARVAAINRICKILSSKFSRISSKRVLILGILFLLVPYLSTLALMSSGVPSIPTFKSDWSPAARPGAPPSLDQRESTEMEIFESSL